MKHISLNIVSAYLFAATTLLFTACSKDDSGSEGTGNPKNPDTAITPSADTGKDNTTDDVVTGGVAEVSFTTATIYGYVNNSEQAALGMGIAYAPTEYITKVSLEQLKEYGLTVEATFFDPGTDNRRFTVHLTNLKPNTTYSYYAYAGQMTANHVLKFKTPAVVLKTNAATDIKLFSATLHGSTNAIESFAHGFIYSTKQDFSDSTVVWPSLEIDDAGAYSAQIASLTPNTTYYYKTCAGPIEYGGFGPSYAYSRPVIYVSNEIKSFTTNSICPDNNHPHAIDLGLPSGTKWACCNVGAIHPDSIGHFFAWGETSPKEEYTGSNYLYSGIFIGNDIAGTPYDAATSNWSGNWKMPNITQYEELINNTTREGIYGKGIYCIASNGKVILLPSKSFQDSYWSSEYSSKYYARVFTINIAHNWGNYGEYNPDFSFNFDERGRGNGYPIRPVYTNDNVGTNTGNGTLENPYSVAKILQVGAAMTADDQKANVYVKGKISQIDEISTTYGNATYYISDNGTTATQFEIYRGYYLNGDKFTAEDQIKVGNEVVVCGTLVNFKGNTIEFTQGSKIIAFISK